MLEDFKIVDKQTLDSNGIISLANMPMTNIIIENLTKFIGCDDCPYGNMSIIRYDDGYLCSIRLFYYNLVKTEKEHYYSCYGYHDVKNFELTFVQLNNDFSIRKIFSNEKFKLYPEYKDAWLRIEDARLINWKNNLYFSSTTTFNDRYCPRLQVCKLNFNETAAKTEHIFNSNEYNTDWNEKNWMAVEDRPFIFVKNASEDGCELFDIEKNELIGKFNRDKCFNGGTPLIKYKNGYIAIVHRKKDMLYTNYLLYFNSYLKVEKISKPFKFSNYDVEFIPSMILLNDDSLIISVTEMDYKSSFKIVNIKEFFKNIDMQIFNFNALLFS